MTLATSAASFNSRVKRVVCGECASRRQQPHQNGLHRISSTNCITYPCTFSQEPASVFASIWCVRAAAGSISAFVYSEGADRPEKISDSTSPPGGDIHLKTLMAASTPLPTLPAQSASRSPETTRIPGAHR